MERDLISYSVDHARFRKDIRTMFYVDLYELGPEYPYAPKFPDEDEDRPMDMSDPTQVGQPVKLQSRGYTPPTPMGDDPANPFAGAGLDAPLGG